MEEKKAYVRKTISVSKYVNDLIDTLSNREFSGNTSAFIAHLVLKYDTCQRCYINNTINISNNAEAPLNTPAKATRKKAKKIII